jgi:hypothetical protein
MSSVLSFAPVRQAALLALAAFVLLVSFALMPHKAYASNVTLVTATTSNSTSGAASTTLAKSGDTVSYQIVLSATPWEAPKINILNMGTTSFSGAGTNWTYSTTSSSSWSDGFVQFYFSFGSTTAGFATTTGSQANITSGGNVRFDKTLPTISSVTSDATGSGVLKVGDTILFTLTPGATEYGATVFGPYNGHNLSWSSSDGGVTYTGTYTVTEGDSDQSSAVQVSARITDAAGNQSSATTTGSDVVKTIDANSPSAPTVDVPAGAYTTNQSVSITSTGSTAIHYTLDGTAPTCSVGTLYTGAVNVIQSLTLKAAGCDNAGNIASASFAYTFSNGAAAAHSHGSGGGGGSSHSYAPTPATPTPAAPALANASVHAAFNRNLTVGGTGDDVKALQVWLNAHGFVVAASGAGSAGMETMTFGGLTRAALAKFQAANHISPAVGFLGPITRAAIAAIQ